MHTTTSFDCHENADGQRRLPPPQTLATPVPEDIMQVMSQIESTIAKAAQVKLWTEQDPTLAQVKKFLKSTWPSTTPDTDLRPYQRCRNEISIQDGCLLWDLELPFHREDYSTYSGTHPGVSRVNSLALCYE